METNKAEAYKKRNLDQTIERFVSLEERIIRERLPKQIAMVIAFLSFMVMGMFFLVAYVASNSSDDIQAWLESVPVMNMIMKVPNLWYIRLIVSVVLAYSVSIILYHLVRTILIIFRRSVRFILPKEPIEKAKKLYKQAEDLKNSNEFEIASRILIVSIAIFLIVFAIFLAYGNFDQIKKDFGMIAFGLAICGAICYVLFLPLLCHMHAKGVTRDEKIELIDICDRLHKYWISVDPQEAARVAEEERERRRRISGSSDRSWLYRGLPQYERYKADAARALGYSVSSGSSSSYDRKLHDELDAAEYAQIITDKFGPDWVGYDAESTTLGPSPDSYDPPGYDPEAYHGPDISGL